MSNKLTKDPKQETKPKPKPKPEEQSPQESKGEEVKSPRPDPAPPGHRTDTTKKTMTSNIFSSMAARGPKDPSPPSGGKSLLIPIDLLSLVPVPGLKGHISTPCAGDKRFQSLRALRGCSPINSTSIPSNWLYSSQGSDQCSTKAYIRPGQGPKGTRPSPAQPSGASLLPSISASIANIDGRIQIPDSQILSQMALLL